MRRRGRPGEVLRTGVVARRLFEGETKGFETSWGGIWMVNAWPSGRLSRSGGSRSVGTRAFNTEEADTLRWLVVAAMGRLVAGRSSTAAPKPPGLVNVMGDMEGTGGSGSSVRRVLNGEPADEPVLCRARETDSDDRLLSVEGRLLSILAESPPVLLFFPGPRC